jgi:hypothetical protein
VEAQTLKRQTQKRQSQKKPPKSHWFLKTLFLAYLLTIISTSVIHAFADDSVSASSLPPSAGWPKSASGPQGSVPRGSLKIRAYIQAVAKANGVSPEVAEWIVSHESQHHPDALGDGGDSRGLWQINKVWHPEVSDACAYSVKCSTNWSVKRIHAGYVDEWSTWKYCRERFDNCPAAAK